MNKAKCLGIFAFILAISLLNFGYAEDYCFLKMKNGESIDTPQGTTYTCKTTSCQTCVVSSSHLYASWTKCSNVSLCPEDNEDEPNTLQINPDNTETNEAEIQNKVVRNQSSSVSTSINSTSINNTGSNIDTQAINLNRKENTLADESQSSNLVLLLGFSTILFLGILILLLFIGKKPKKKKLK